MPSQYNTMTTKKSTYLLPFILVTSLFFLWGIANNLNGILIPHLRKALQLTNMQSTFVDTAVYLAYFSAAIPAGMFLKKFGYKKGIIFGLFMFSAGALLFVPAANMRAFEVFLLGYFIIGFGLTFLETAANPYVTKLGDAEGATRRINLAQSFNGLAAALGPAMGTIFILSGKEYSQEEWVLLSESEQLQYLTQEAGAVKLPYILIALAVLTVAILFMKFRFPEVNDNESEDQTEEGSISNALKRKHLRWAIIAQFFYVGAQISFTSFFIRIAIKSGGLDEKTAGFYFSILWGVLFMAGRFSGTYVMKFIAPQKLLSVYAGICVLLSIAVMQLEGVMILVALGGLSFFMSIMFPTIFSLGIQEMGRDTKPASSLIIMSIIGGAIFPVIMGYIIDANRDDLQLGYIVPLIGYLVVLYFGMYGYKPQKTHK
jgi:MFS transporter, FHS family, L-fucose permease